MRHVVLNNTESSENVKDPTKFFSFRRPKRVIRPTSKSPKSQKRNNIESQRYSAHVHLDSSSVVNERSATMRLNELQKSKNNRQCHSLSFNHLHDNGIKSLINSDTFSQTKTLLYTDHQKSPNPCLRFPFKNGDVHQSPPNSIDSLNSSDDPEIVAAIDQIASTMGLIDCEVSRIYNNDPVNYLLKTRSFSEKISIHKSSPNNNRTENRVKSYVDHTESNNTKINNNNFQKESIIPISKKKETGFRKMIQKFSPKLLRRTKSTSPTPSKLSSSILNKNSTPLNNANDSLIMVDAITSSTLSNETCYEETMDVIEQKSEYTNGNENKNQEMSPPLEICSPVIRSLSPSSARYINISLSAFGYGPIPSLSHLSPVRRSICQTNKYNNISGDGNHSDKEVIQK